MKENYLKKELYDLIQSDHQIFDFLQSGSLDGVWYWDLENIENEWMSPKFWETLGYNPEEMKHKSSEWQDIIFDEDLKKATDNFMKHCEDPTHPYDQIVRYKHKNGSTIWIRCRGLAIRDKTSKPIRMLGAHTDITQIKLLEEKLLENIHLNDLVSTATSSGIYTADYNGICTYVNESALNLLGYKDEKEVVGKDIHDLVHHSYEDGKPFKAKDCSLYQAFIRLETVRQEDIIWRKDKTFFHVLYHSIPQIIGGKAVGTIVSFTDISERKKLEVAKNTIQDALFTSEEQHRLLTTQMDLGFALHEMIYDEKGNPIDYRFISVNDSYELLTGLKREDIIGKTVLEVIPNVEKYWIETYGKVATTGQPIKFERYSKEITKYFSISAYSPRKGQFALVIDDVTSRKHIELERYRIQDLLAHTLNSIGDAVIATDTNGIITGINPVACTLTGWSELEAIGQSFTQVFNVAFEDGSAPIDNPIKRALTTNSVVELAKHAILISRNQTRRFVEDTAAPIKNADNENIGAVIIFRDITEKKQKEDEVIYASEHDYLTDLHNRRYYFDQFHYLNQPQFYPLGLMMFDVNGLKRLNDAFGHHVGDEALIMIGNSLRDVFEEKDIVSRIGGDEFAALLPNTNAETLQAYKEKLVNSIKLRPINKIELSIAVGYVLITSTHKDIDEMQKLAEHHMYSHKSIVGASVRSKAISAILETLTDKYDVEKRHSAEVSRLCKQIGIELELREDELKELEQAGMFHDIGKISIPDSILDKPGKLTDKEFDIIKTHTQAGYQILRAADEYSDLAIHALHHHERWDGKGYPGGIKGEDIPLYCRIINVVDAYEAMTADRPYRNKLSKEYAVSEIIRCAGTQFDPNIAKLFVEKVLKEEWIV